MRILMLSHETDNASVIPALDLLPHTVVVCAPDLRIFLEDNEYDVVLVDSRNNLAEMRSFCGSLATVCTLPVIHIHRRWSCCAKPRVESRRSSSYHGQSR